MKTVKASEKFSKKDTEILNAAERMLLNINETRVAEKITAMAKNGWTALSLFSNIRGRRDTVCVNQPLVESILRDHNFNYMGNDRFRFVTEKERKKILLTIGKSFREIRMELNLTQEQVATELNVSREYVSCVENGNRRLSVIQAERIAAVFGMELSITLKRGQSREL
jgi:DNA-binding XRE family transcriptional regulator